MFTFSRSFFSTHTHAAVFFAGILLITIFGVLDVITGVEIAFSIFYVLPVILVTWYVGRWPGIAIAFLAAMVWLLADVIGGHLLSHAWIYLWNMATRLFVYVLSAWLVSEIRLREARRRSLERIFFHDVLNSMTGVRGFAEHLHDCSPAAQREICAHILSSADQVIREIEGQRALSAAEHHELSIEPSVLNSRQVLEQVLERFRSLGEAAGVHLHLAAESEEITFTSDEVLLGRILGNMVKNALEAAQPGDAATAGCRKKDGMVEFWVHNPQHIPLRDQGQIFQSMFSTKGRDRGLGTYGMRMLSRELGGDVSFTTSPDRGTTFRARYPLTR